MYNVTIQTGRKGMEPWDNSEKHPMTFKTWEGVSDFSYRLSLIHKVEIRVEYKGNGHYYHPQNAENYLNN